MAFLILSLVIGVEFVSAYHSIARRNIYDLYFSRNLRDAVERERNLYLGCLTYPYGYCPEEVSWNLYPEGPFYVRRHIWEYYPPHLYTLRHLY